MWDLLVLPLTAGAPALQIGVRRITKMSKLSKLQIVQTRSFRTQYNIKRCGVCVTTCCHPNSGNCPGKKGVRTFFPEFALRRRQEIVRVRHVNESRNISVTFRRGANLHTLAPPEKKFIKMSHFSYIFRCCRLASVFLIMLKCSMFAPGRNLLSVKLTRRKKTPFRFSNISVAHYPKCAALTPQPKFHLPAFYLTRSQRSQRWKHPNLGR